MSKIVPHENIELYISAVIEIKDSINKIKGERYIANHKKTLLFSVIDMLSKGVYGNRYRDRTTMFEKFILEFCEWKYAERISLQQLVHLLDKTEENEFLRLKDYAKTELFRFPSSEPVPFSYDPSYKQVQKLMTKGKTTILGIDLTTLKHVSLLWKLRNSLVHEARSKGALQVFDYETEPHYVHYSTLETDIDNKLITTNDRWEIYYPVGFLNMLIETALLNIRKHFEVNSINPYENYDFNSLWIEIKN